MLKNPWVRIPEHVSSAPGVAPGLVRERSLASLVRVNMKGTHPAIKCQMSAFKRHAECRCM